MEDATRGIKLHPAHRAPPVSGLCVTSNLKFPLTGNLQPFIVALLSITSHIMPYLDNISVMSSMEGEFAEWLREFSWTFGMSLVWVKTKKQSVSSSCDTALMHITLILKSLSSRHFQRRSKLQLKNRESTLRTLEFKVWNYEKGALAKMQAWWPKSVLIYRERIISVGFSCQAMPWTLLKASIFPWKASRGNSPRSRLISFGLLREWTSRLW